MIFNLSINLTVLFFSILITAYLGFLSLKSNSKRFINRLFASMTLFLIIWMLANYLSDNIQDYSLALFCTKITFFAPSLFATLLFYFSLVFPQNIKIKRYKELLIFLPYILITCLLFTNLVVKEIILKTEGVEVIFGSLGYLFVIYLFGYLITSLIILLKKTLKAKKSKKFRLKFLTIGLSVFIVLSLASNLLIPFIWGIFWPSQYGPNSILLFLIFTTYAILKYRLLDIRLIIKRSTIYFLSFLITISLGTGLALTLHRYSQIHATYIGIIDIIFVLIIFNPLRHIIRRIANRIMFRALYTYQEALKELSKQAGSIIQLKKLLNLISNVLFKVMQVERVGIILNLPQKNDFYSVKLAGFEEKTAIHLSQKDFLIETLKKDKELLVTEELVLMLEDEQKEEKKEKLKLLIKKLQAIKADVALPLIAHQELIGLIILGPKEDQNAYSKQDLDILDNLSIQLALALENARLFNYMEEMVNQKTQQVKEKVEEVRKANLKLKKANQAREEFLHIASHQLRTPLSAAWSVMSSFADGTLENETPAERQRFYKMAFDSLDRLNNIVNDLLDGAEVERKKLNIQKKEINVINIIKDSVAKGKEEADKKGISLVLKIDDNTPKTIFADEKYLRMVFVNLLDNAIKYTPEDLSVERKKILIKVFSKTKSIETEKDKKKKRFLVFIIQDQGIGIPKAEQNNLFKQFKRASNARKVDISGTGLGLYIVKKVIQQHNGTIEMQSEGEDKGTRFRVEVPV